MSDRPGPVLSALDVLEELRSDFPLATAETQSPMPWSPWLLVADELIAVDAELEERTVALHEETAAVTAEPWLLLPEPVPEPARVTVAVSDGPELLDWVSVTDRSAAAVLSDVVAAVATTDRDVLEL